jgi:hypothetical protein
MVNSKEFEIIQIAQNLSFLYRAEYILLRFDILQYCRIRYYKHLGLLFRIFWNLKMSNFKKFKNQTNFLFFYLPLCLVLENSYDL